MKALLLCVLLAYGSAATIEEIFIAQKHVQPITDPYVKLVGDLEAMVKVHVTMPEGGTEPSVAIFALIDDVSVELAVSLPGCAVSSDSCSSLPLPTSFPSGKGEVVHATDDLSYKAMIGADYVRRGLKVKVNVGDIERSHAVSVGAPSVLTMLSFDLLFFGRSYASFTDGDSWLVEFANRLPIKTLQQQRIRNLNLQSVIVPPRGGFKATLVHSEAHYKVKNGESFDGEQATALRITEALYRAGKLRGPFLTYSWIFGVPAGGQAGGFSGVGNPTSEGVTIHELGHALGLPHWGGVSSYPYKGFMHGIDAPDVYSQGLSPHVGPNWAFYHTTREFIPPTVQADNIAGMSPGTWKADPMQGGGSGWQEPGYKTTHFSDYSSFKMQQTIENTLVVQRNGDYYKWDDTTGKYSKKQQRSNYAEQINVEVMTLIMSLAVVDDKVVAWIYDPIGPYQGAFDPYYDPTNATELLQAQSAGKTGDYTLKLWIGGRIQHVLVNVDSTGCDNCHSVWAWNFFPGEGNIDRAELLQTPAVHQNGVPTNPAVLFTYRGSFLLGDMRGGPCPNGYSIVSNTGQCEAGVTAIGEMLEYVPSKNIQVNGTQCGWCGSDNQAYMQAPWHNCDDKRWVCYRTSAVGLAKPSVDCTGVYADCEYGTRTFTQTQKKFGAGADCASTHLEEAMCVNMRVYRVGKGTGCPRDDVISDEAACMKIAGYHWERTVSSIDRPPGCFWDINSGVYFNRNTDPDTINKIICGCAGGICFSNARKSNQCSSPPTFADGTVIFDHTNDHGSIATFGCNVGETYSGTATVKCDATTDGAAWPAPVQTPTCTGVDEYTSGASCIQGLAVAVPAVLASLVVLVLSA